MPKQIDIHVRLDARAFRRYCAFDTFRRQRGWYVPVLVSMLLITASLALLIWAKARPTLAAVLLGLGLAVPMVVFGLYVIQIEAQVAAQKLKTAPSVYSLSLRGKGITVTNDQKKEPPVELEWSRIWGAFRRADCVYLYVNPQRAFILPDGQASASPEELWAFLRQHLGDARCVERR